MSRFSLPCALIVLAFFVSQPLARAGEPPIDRGVGRQVPDFTLPDTSGKEVHLYGYAGKKAVVIVFIGADCSTSDLYLPRLAELARKYETDGVAFLAVDSNKGADAAKLAALAKKHGVPFPVLIDKGNVIAETFQARHTCEALVVDGQARLRYRGAIDDQYTPKERKERPAKTYVVDALAAVLAGRDVAVPATAVAGRPIDRVEPKVNAVVNGPRVRASTPAPPDAGDGKKVEVGKVNYAADVAPIVQNKCQQCHRPGEVGPFALLTYEDARRHAATIREVVEERRMPPWHADPRYGHFSNDRSLSAKDRAVILAWVDQGTPPGDPKDAPAAKTFPEGWSIGKPDFVFKMPEPYTVAATGILAYQYFRVPTNFKEDTWIQAAEARPGDRSVVHHILVAVDDHKGGGDGLDDAAESYFVAYAPGDAPCVFAPGAAKLIPAGADLIFQVHYTPIGVEKVDCSSVGMIRAKGPVKQKAVTVGIPQRQFTIPPGDDNHAVKSSLTLPQGIKLLSLFPHMHLRGKSFQYTASYPDGKSEVLLSVPAYDFGWQSVYRLAEPKHLPKGTRIDCLAHFDNSAKNPANPDATQTVRWGEQTFEEMMIGYFDCVADDPPAKAAAKPRTGPVEKPFGTWKSAPGQPATVLTISEDNFELSLSIPPNKVAFEADCATTKDGVVYGRVRKVTVGNGPAENDVFSFRYDVDKDTLELSSWKGSGFVAQGVILEGKYKRVAAKEKTK
jgi:peroxiredoxin/mono/diheme cytochrome c family protein